MYEIISFNYYFRNLFEVGCPNQQHEDPCQKTACGLVFVNQVIYESLWCKTAKGLKP